MLPRFKLRSLLGRTLSARPLATFSSTFDRTIIKTTALSVATTHGNSTSIPSLHPQYQDCSGRVLDAVLPYEPTPAAHRRVLRDATVFPSRGVVLVAYAIGLGTRHELHLCSGFAIEVDKADLHPIVTCTHTLEQVHRSPLLREAGAISSAVVFWYDQGVKWTSDMRILSSLPSSDLMTISTSGMTCTTLPVTPYPSVVGSSVYLHLVADTPPTAGVGSDARWIPWIGGWRTWEPGSVMGYRDKSGGIAEPGTYDALSHLIYSPTPTEGSSGGPIIDAHGAVVGVVLGSRMQNRIEGLQGWGVPSECIYEMFRLPGLNIQAKPDK